MGDTEREQLIGMLSRLWPRKFTDSEMVDFVNRFDEFRFGDVEDAVNAHKNASKFRPTVAEIRERLTGKGKAPASTSDWPDHPEIIRRRWGYNKTVMTDAEAIVRFRRDEWWRYKAGRAQPSESMLYRSKILCQNELVASGMGLDEAHAWTEWLDAEPGMFRTALSELRGELVDPFV